jgi:hypothetical protein
MDRLSTFSLRILALIVAFAAASAAGAQDNQRRPDQPPPFKEKGGDPIPLPATVVTPQQRTEEIEKWAREHQQPEQPQQFSYVRFFWPADAKELAALAGYSLMVLTVQTHKSEELPLSRVYLRTATQLTPLLKIASWRMDVDPRLLAYTRYGPYREDGFYLFPFSAIVRSGQIQADFAMNRTAYPVLDFPAYEAPGWLSNVQSPDAAPGARPDPAALARIIRRSTAGFPVVR